MVCNSNLSMVLADSECLYQSMENFFSNAVKYFPLNSLIEVNVKRTGNNVRFSVADHGAALGNDDQKKLIGKF